VASSHRRILGQKIRAYRQRAEMNQEELAEKAALSYKYLGEVERGIVNISLDSMVRIAKALKIQVHDLTKDF
jgi:transcriptional regulator with XRE-family HTH domain